MDTSSKADPFCWWNNGAIGQYAFPSDSKDFEVMQQIDWHLMISIVSTELMIAVWYVTTVTIIYRLPLRYFCPKPKIGCTTVTTSAWKLNIIRTTTVFTEVMSVRSACRKLVITVRCTTTLFNMKSERIVFNEIWAWPSCVTANVDVIECEAPVTWAGQNIIKTAKGTVDNVTWWRWKGTR